MTRTRLLFWILPLTLVLGGCKLVNTHVFKITARPQIDDAPDLRIATTKGNLYLPLARLDDKARALLTAMRPFTCLAVRTAEPYEMQRREVRFSDFKLRTLPETDPECRKVKVGTRISVQ